MAKSKKPKKPKRNETREERISMEIVVDAYDEGERAMGRYYPSGDNVVWFTCVAWILLEIGKLFFARLHPKRCYRYGCSFRQD